MKKIILIDFIFDSLKFFNSLKYTDNYFFLGVEYEWYLMEGDKINVGEKNKDQISQNKIRKIKSPKLNFNNAKKSTSSERKEKTRDCILIKMIGGDEDDFNYRRYIQHLVGQISESFLVDGFMHCSSIKRDYTGFARAGKLNGSGTIFKKDKKEL